MQALCTEKKEDIKSKKESRSVIEMLLFKAPNVIKYQKGGESNYNLLGLLFT